MINAYRGPVGTIYRGDYYWCKVVFSDEKKFNLDRPDRLSYSCNDLNKKPRSFGPRKHGGGSVMVWDAIHFYGVSSLVFLKGRKADRAYYKTLEDALLSFTADKFGESTSCHFQQDGASISG